jgi:hypothetical protein
MDEIIDLGRVYWSDPEPGDNKDLLEENQLLREKNEKLRKELVEMKKKEKSRLIRKFNSVDDIPEYILSEAKNQFGITNFQTKKENRNF